MSPIIRRHAMFGSTLSCGVASALLAACASSAPACTPGTTLPLGGMVNAAVCPPECPPAAIGHPSLGAGFGASARTAGAGTAGGGASGLSTLGIGGSGSPKSSLGGGGGGGSARGGPLVDVSIVDFAFLPEVVTVIPNTTIRWTNNAFFSAHSAARSGNGAWDTGFLSPDDFADVVFGPSTAGFAFDYVCGVHPFTMFGTVEVLRFGDANRDTTVNLDDFNILATNFGTSGHDWDDGDFNDDGTVDLDDFNLLASNFGLSVQPAGPEQFAALSVLVPEPTLVTVALLGAAALASRRRNAPR